MEALHKQYRNEIWRMMKYLIAR